MRYRAKRRRKYLLSALLAATVIAACAAAFAVLAWAPPFSDARRDLAARLLTDFLEWPIAVRGDAVLVFADPMKLKISQVQYGGASGAKLPGARPVEHVELSFPLWSMLAGRIDVSELVMSGGRVDLTGEAGGSMSPGTLTQLPSWFIKAPLSDHLEIRDVVIDYQDASGWEYALEIESFSSRQTAAGGQIVLESRGILNGLPYSLAAHFAKLPGDAVLQGKGPFDLSIGFSGLTAKLAGSLDVSGPVATIEATAELKAETLATLLELMQLTYEVEGNGTLTTSLTGPLDSMRAERIELGLGDKRGRAFELTGSFANLIAGEGIDVAFSADLSRDDAEPGKPAAIYEVDLAGLKGIIDGDLDRLVVRQIFVFTNVAAAELQHIGPIRLGRMVRDADGKLGFLGIRIREGPKDDPVFDLSADMKDVLGFSGIDLTGRFNISLAEILMPAPGPRAHELGRLKGKLSLSDASGALQLTEFQGDLRGTKLISLSMRKVGDQAAPADPLVLKLDLDIADFGTVAETLGATAEAGAVGFNGELIFPKRRPSVRGAAIIGKTEVDVAASMRIKDGRPFISASIASDLLYLGDIERGVDVYNVFADMDNDEIEIDLDDSFVQKTRVELDLRIAELDANGKKVGNIRAQGHYQDGIAELAPLHMSYLQGNVDGRVRADTNHAPTSVAIKGQIDKLDMGSFLESLAMTPLVTGALDSKFDFSIVTGDRAAIDKSLNGKFTASIWGGSVASRKIDLGGQNVVDWAFSDPSGSGQAKLVCAVVALDFSDGRGRADSIVIETANVQIVGAGDIDLPADTIALSFNTRPKRQQLVDVATPFSVSGKLSEPVVELAPGVKSGRAVTEALTLPFNVLGLLLPKAQSKEPHRPCVVEDLP